MPERTHVPMIHSHTVPSWADACILKEMPNLTMQYMADTASIELIRNCQEEGLLRHTCRGKEVSVATGPGEGCNINEVTSLERRCEFQLIYPASIYIPEESKELYIYSKKLGELYVTRYMPQIGTEHIASCSFS